MKGFNPEGVIIDGALPRTPKERCIKLLAHCEDIASAAPPRFGKEEYLDKIHRFNIIVDELAAGDNDATSWYEVENDICQLMADGANGLELDEYHVYIGDPDPGDVRLIQTLESLTASRLRDIREFVKTLPYVVSMEPLQEYSMVENKFAVLFSDDQGWDYNLIIHGPEEV